MTGWLRQMATSAIRLAALYTIASLLGFVLLVLAFKLGIFQQIDILFYRGLVLVALVFAITFGCLAGVAGVSSMKGIGLRDAFAASVLSFSLNLSFLIVVPVTVDRSISIFMLSEMDARPRDSFTSDAMSGLFTQVYVGDRRQIDRRLYEQTVSGNVDKDGDRYRISARGRRVVAMARFVATLFESHAGILTPNPVRPPAPGAH